MDKLNGILNADNMAMTVLVAMTNHGSQRGGLTRARGTHKDNNTPLGHGEVFDDGR